MVINGFIVYYFIIHSFWLKSVTLPQPLFDQNDIYVMLYFQQAESLLVS